MDNENPQVFDVLSTARGLSAEDADDPIDALEIFGAFCGPRCFSVVLVSVALVLCCLCGCAFVHAVHAEHVRGIVDPEHPMTLEQLGVVRSDLIDVDDAGSHVLVRFTPTVGHCSMATLIGLCIRVKLQRALPPRFKIDVEVAEGSHDQEPGVNKQLNDKERVSAAMDNPNLLALVHRGLQGAA